MAAPKHDSIAAALAAAQAEMSHATIDKNNPHFNSRFASLASVIDATRPILSKHGIAVLQAPSWNAEANRVEVTTELLWGGDSLRCTLSARPRKDDPQAMGSAITYLRRYSLAAMCCLAADDDDDGNAASGQGQEPQQPERPKHHPSWEADHKRFMVQLREFGLRYEQVAAYLEGKGGTRPSTWHSDDRARFIDALAAGNEPDLYAPSDSAGEHS